MSLGTGVYVHIPFCATRCDYCAFATWTDRGHLVDAYVDACVADVGRRRAAGLLDAVATVYVGGGTPSMLEAGQLVRILDAIPRDASAEVTVECNPDSIDARKLRAYRDHGVSRVSLGVQSTRAHVLAALGRTHDRANVTRAVDAIGATGFPTFNLDVIAGAAAESDDDFAATMSDVLALGSPHVSVYGLMVEAGTPLERRIATGEVDAPDPDVQADRYLHADDRLRAAGLEWYEVSSWARPGHECRHNLGYWFGEDCVAIGAAAHGHTAGTRWWNVPLPERYVARVAAGESPVAAEERPDPATEAFERVGLALRTRAGVPLAGGIDRSALAELTEAGLVEVADDHVVLTRTGRLLASEVTLRLDPRPDGGRRHRAGTRYHGVPGCEPSGAEPSRAGAQATRRPGAR